MGPAGWPSNVLPALQLHLLAEEGLGTVRHFEVRQLWLQEKVMRGDIRLVNVSTSDNLADSLSPRVSRDTMHRRIVRASQRVLSGRHELGSATEC